MSDRQQDVPQDVQNAKWLKKWIAVFTFAVGGGVAIMGGSPYLVTVFVGAGCLLLDVPIVSVIRAVRGKNGG